MINSVGIKSWRSNSRVVHATADSARGSWSFTRRDVAQPVFAHEPTVSRAPTGEWVMFFTTNAGEVPGSQCSLPLTCGNNGSSCLSDLNAQQCPCKKTQCAPLSTRMSYAKQPSGPWSTPVLVPSKGSGDTNLACIIRPNSSLVCLGRPSLGVMRADHWRNTSGYTWYPIHYGSGEDPMLWLDKAEDGTEVLHAVLHGGGWSDPFGHHYWSTDGGWKWEGSGAKVYGNVVDVVGQGTKILSRRERPHVVLDADNRPVALTNGVTEAWPCTTRRTPDRPPCHPPFNPFAGHNPKNCGVGFERNDLVVPIGLLLHAVAAFQKRKFTLAQFRT